MQRAGREHGSGGPARTKDDWVKIAIGATLDLVGSQLAVPHVELEARLCEVGFHHDGDSDRLDRKQCAFPMRKRT